MKKLTWKDLLIIVSVIGHFLGAKGVIPAFLAPSSQEACKQLQTLDAIQVEDAGVK